MKQRENHGGKQQLLQKAVHPPTLKKKKIPKN